MSTDIGKRCPKCGAQVFDPYRGMKQVHDVDACQGPPLINTRPSDMIDEIIGVVDDTDRVLDVVLRGERVASTCMGMIDDIEKVLEGCIRKAELAAVAQCYGGEGRAQLAVRDLLEHLNRAAADLRILRFAGDEEDD